MTLTKTIIRTFIAAAATLPLLLVSCQHRDADTIANLQTAEELLETNPRKALALLDSIASSRPPKGEAALYAILRTQADYKCFVPLTSDSLIRVATDYYGRPRRPHHHAALAWYSLGCVRAEQGDDIGAVEAFLTAQPLFPDTTSRFYALCCQNLGHHYANRGMFDDALAAYRTFGRSPAVSERDTFVNNYHIARVLINKGTADEADTLLQRLIRHPRAAEGLKQKAHFEAAKLCCYLREDYPAAKAHATTVCVAKRSVLSLACWAMPTSDWGKLIPQPPTSALHFSRTKSSSPRPTSAARWLPSASSSGIPTL